MVTSESGGAVKRKKQHVDEDNSCVMILSSPRFMELDSP